MTLLLIFVVLLFLYSLVSARLDRTVITAPIVFTVFGILSVVFFLPLTHTANGGESYFLTIAEVGLVLLLFSDAFKTDLKVLKSFRSLPVRLLSIGMLLTILLGMAAALLIFPNLTIWEAGILAAILAPTDAGLGQIIVNSKIVPVKIRQSLNVEAGLNDGLSVPFMLFFIALAAGSAAGFEGSLFKYMVEQLGYGAVIGIVVGFAGGRLLRMAEGREWIGHTWSQLGLLALPIICMLVSEETGASMFIAAFVGGMGARAGFDGDGGHDGTVGFTEDAGQLFNLSVFFLFGLLLAAGAGQLEPRHFVYAAISLTVVRMLPVAVSLIGTRLKAATVLFMGWFGPRGLASIVLGLVFLEHTSHQPGESTIRLAVMATVLISIFAHGLSALPGMNIYAQKLKGINPDAPEFTADGANKPEPAAQVLTGS